MSPKSNELHLLEQAEEQTEKLIELLKQSKEDFHKYGYVHREEWTDIQIARREEELSQVRTYIQNLRSEQGSI